jgi:hypothetical protein
MEQWQCYISLAVVEPADYNAGRWELGDAKLKVSVSSFFNPFKGGGSDSKPISYTAFPLRGPGCTRRSGSFTETDPDLRPCRRTEDYVVQEISL